MKFSNERTQEVKKWVIERIEHISDADPDVLAEYVLAILKSDVPDAEIRAQMLEHLPDFLNEHTLKFVDEVFAKYAAQPIPAIAGPTSTVPDSPGYSPPSSPIPIQPYHSLDAVQEARAVDLGSKQARKRSYQEFNGQGQQQQQQSGGPRTSKSSRSGRGIRERNALPRSQYPSPAFQPTAFHTQPFSNFPRPPTPPPGFPAFDPGDMVSSFMAMQAMFPHMTGMSSTSDQKSTIHKRQRCRDYDTKGFCVRGSACHFDHGNNHLVAPAKDEYDPTNAMIRTNGHHEGPYNVQVGPGPGEMGLRKPTRTAFSDHRTLKDRSHTAIVVEQIPEDYFDEQSVMNFFSQFGNITEITMKAYKRLAIVKYDTRSAAQRAWESPKAIFDNRFVKVYWHQPDPDAKAQANGAVSHARSSSDINKGGSSGLDDTEAFKRRQQERQQAHERRQAALRKTEKAKRALIRRKEEVTKRYEAEKAVLRAKLAAKGEELPTDGAEEVSSEALALREQLAKLEAEAEALGIDPNAPADESFYIYRGRGTGRAFSSRGGYFGRGRGYYPYQPTRGSYRGSLFVRGRYSAVRKLDNRPRNIAISGAEFDARKEEMLRAYLVSVGEFESIERDPERTDCFIVSFKERWQAERVMNGQTDVPGVGKIKLAWVPSAPMTTTTTTTITEQPTMDQEDEVMINASSGKPHELHDDTHDELEVNLDVAGGDDEWGNIS